MNMNFETKYNFGDEVFLIREKTAEIKCNMCNGECVINNPINQTKIKCPYCRGTGKVILDEAKIWYVVEESFKIIELRIKAHSQNNYAVKYGVRQTHGSKNNPSELNMFSTKELAQLECDKRNHPAKRIDLKDIQITRDFESTMPNSDKIKECYDYYKSNNKLNKDIIVDKNNILVDGYVAYLVCKMLGKENVRVLINL